MNVSLSIHQLGTAKPFDPASHQSLCHVFSGKETCRRNVVLAHTHGTDRLDILAPFRTG
jgi:hypothetical protein